MTPMGGMVPPMGAMAAQTKLVGLDISLMFTANVLDGTTDKTITLKIVNGEHWKSIMTRAYEQRAVDFQKVRATLAKMRVHGIVRGKPTTEMDARTSYTTSNGVEFSMTFNGGAW